MILMVFLLALTVPSAPVEFKHVYPKSENILPQQRDYIRAYVDTMENALLAPGFADPDTGYRQYLDVDAFDFIPT